MFIYILKEYSFRGAEQILTFHYFIDLEQAFLLLVKIYSGWRILVCVCVFFQSILMKQPFSVPP